MSSDDYDSIDSPRVASLSDLSRIPSQRLHPSRRQTSETSDEEDEDPEDLTPTPSSLTTKNMLLEPLHHIFRSPQSEPRVQMREKKHAAPRAQDATVSQFIGEDAPGQKFKRRSAERHSMLAGAADFASRRSPFHSGNGRWTDLFSSNRFKRKIRQKINNDQSSSSNNDDYGIYGGTRSIGGVSLASNSSGESYTRSCTDEELREQFKRIMLDKNIPASKVNEIVAMTPMDQVKAMVTNARRTDDAAARKQSPEWNIHVLSQILKAPNLLDCKQDIVTVGIQLKCQSVSFLYQFADNVQDESGRTGADLICRLYSSVLKRLKSTSAGSKQENELIDFLQEIVRCVRIIVNTYCGLELVFRRNSPVCSLLIQTLFCLNRRRPREDEPSEIRQLRSEVVSICSSVMLVSHETLRERAIEMTGQQKIFRELTALANAESKETGEPVSRFRPFVKCIDFFEHRDPNLLMRVLLMLNMLINGVDRNTGDDQPWTEETMWQARMRLRSEAAKDGLGKYVEKFTSSEHVDSKVREVAQNMLDEQNADLETLIGKLENVKGEYDSLDGCFELLAANSEATGTESILLSILQLLAITHEDQDVKRAYMKLIETCVSEIVLHRTPLDPDSPEKFVFEMPVAEIIDRMQDEEMAKKLRQATAAKQEAVAMQGEYWKTLCEFQKETQALRKHIADPKSTPLPPPTKMTLSAPSMGSSGSSSLPPVTGGPPPPPGLPPVTGGPPPPPPLPPITGGPPPPPGLPPISGGPPPPPPPPGGGPPPPPPPPPPPGGFKGPGGGPPPPPPPGMFAPMAPVLPDYLPPKKVPKVDGPMRKFPWGASTINPRDIPRDSFWVGTNEDQLTSDRMFERLRSKFSTKPTTSTAFGGAGGKLETKKKLKTAQVIHDDKLLQKLGILQGSVKMSHSELKNALLEVNEKVLTVGFLEQLRAAVPPEKELIDKLCAVDKAQFEEMPEGEQFITRLLQIRGLPLRLDLILFKMRFTETLNELKPAMSSVMEACEEVRKSDGFRIFLKLVLATGNFMGGATKNYSSAYAFDMKMLTRLVDTKDVDNRHTLLQHLIEEMRRIDPKRARFALTDFHHCIESSRVNADELRKTVQLAETNIRKLENCLKVYKTQSERDRFEEKMKPFLERAVKEFATVATMSEKMRTDWEAIVKYYAFSTKKYPMEEFFADIRTFSEQYAAAWKELDAEAEAANAEAKRKEETQKRKQQQQQRVPLAEKVLSNQMNMNRPMPRTPAAMIRVSTAADKAGVLDELDRAAGNDAFLQTLMSATNSRTPRSGVPARTRGVGRTIGGGLDRQRSRHEPPLASSSSNTAAAACRRNVLLAHQKTSSDPALSSEPSSTGRRGSADSGRPPSTALERVKALGVGLPVGQNELKIKVRRKGQPAVPVMDIPEKTSSSQVSPTHKENDPTASSSSTTITPAPTTTPSSTVPSTEELLSRLNGF